jgi:hypothetical protein
MRDQPAPLAIEMATRIARARLQGMGGTVEHRGMVDHPERWSSPFTQVEMRRLWTYSDGALTAKGYRLPGGTARAGSWVLVNLATGNVQGVVPPGEFSRRFRPMDLFADVPALATYLGTVTAADGTALVDLVLDRNPFMLANGPRRVARPHALIVPRSHRDGWSSATAQELAACHTAMTLVAAWYHSMDGGHAVFGANDSAPNLDYLRDTEAAGGTLAEGGTGAAVTKNPRQEVQHAHLHAFYAERGRTENHESSALEGYPVIGAGYRAFGASLGSDAVKVEPDSTRLAADVSVAAQPWVLVVLAQPPVAAQPGEGPLHHPAAGHHCKARHRPRRRARRRPAAAHPAVPADHHLQLHPGHLADPVEEGPAVALVRPAVAQAGNCARMPSSSTTAPSRSPVLAAVTWTFSTMPSVPASRCRLRPLTFFPPS